MAAGYPVKVNYLTGDVLTAANLNDLAGTVNFYDPTAKGDLFPATSGDAVARLAVGANNTILTADSTAATGMKWAAAAGGGSGLNIVQAETAFTSVTSVVANNVFTSAYTNYKILMTVTGASGSGFGLRLRVSGIDATTNYDRQVIDANGTSLSSFRQTSQTSYEPGAVQTSSTSFSVDIFSPALAVATNFISPFANFSPPNITSTPTTGKHTTATAYDGINFIASVNMTGTYTIYGYGK